MTVEPALVLEVEERAFRAWPAAEVEDLDGWRLRFNAGVTGRANSVWPNVVTGSRPLVERLDCVETAYRSRGLPPKFQVCPAACPSDLDAALTERGYGPEAAAASVSGASVDQVLGRIEESGQVVTLAERISEAWFAVYASAEAFPPEQALVRRRIIERIAERTAFVLAVRDGAAASVALGVVDGDWLGVFCVSTLPEYRRQGLARATLRALLQWGAARGATRTYLQVMEENSVARRLYGSAGYVPIYRYHYRTLQDRNDG